MGRKEKKGEKGNAVKYIARTQAVKKLQISLSQFRRLCILKGVYPVEPKGKSKVTKGSTALRTYYYRKDIQFLLHEPVLKVLREEKIHSRKFNKAIGKKQYEIAKQLNQMRPFYTLDHIIKERYPTFIDALRDLDDALSMIFLFATLPMDDKIKLEHVRECQRLSAEFLQYVIRTKCLKKVFLSIKGIYYQVSIKGQDITWVTPYQFSQAIPYDVDFKVMSTFLELYETLLGFVNFKLYSELNLMYPPRIDLDRDAAAAGLDALVVESKAEDQVVDAIVKTMDAAAEKLEVKRPNKKKLNALQKKIDNIVDDNSESDNEEMEEIPEEDAPMPVVEPTTAEEMVPTMSGLETEVSEQSNLFQKCVFWISREVPRYSLEFVIKSCGGQVGWDETSGAGSLFKEDDPRITHHIMDRPVSDDTKSSLMRYENREYLQPQWIYDCVNAGKFVKTTGYHPGEKLPAHLSPFVVVKEGDYVPEEALEGEDVDSEAEMSAEESENEVVEESADEVTEELTKPKKKMSASAKEEKEAKELAVMMMSKRDKKLYDKIQFGKKRKQAEVDKLKAKKAALKNKN